MAEDNYSEFVNCVQSSLQAGNTVHALTVFKDNRNSTEVKNNSWDLIPMICKFLTADHQRDSNAVFKCSEQLINIVAEDSNPEEALLQFIEEIEELIDDTKFRTLIQPLQKILLRIPKKRLNSLAWSFHAIQTFLNKCDIPEDENLVGKEKLLMDSYEITKRITNLYSELLPFYDVFIKELETTNEGVRERQAVLCKFLVQLLGKPLGFLDMEVFEGIKSKARVIAENLVQKIFKTMDDPCVLLKLRFDTESSELTKPNTLAISVLFYLVYSEEICIENVPKVYSPVYFFQNALCLVTSLLETDSQMCIEKGIGLGLRLFEYVKFRKLSYLLLDSDDHSKFCKALAKVIVYHPLEAIRKACFKIYQSYINTFEIRGFYLLVYNLMSNLTHSGLKGYTITQYKEQLAQEFLNNEQNMSVYVKGTKLLKLLRKFCYLPKNEESDLIDLSDQIMATLNLLRYLALRDKKNVTQIWDYFSLIEDIYLAPLRKGTELSRAHNELKIKELEEETASGDKNKSDPEMSVTISGQSMLLMSKDERLKMLQFSITAFDVMDSLLSRVVECIDLFKC